MTPNSKVWLLGVLLTAGVAQTIPPAQIAAGQAGAVQLEAWTPDAGSANTATASAGRSKAGAVEPARALVQRLLPAQASHFALEQVPPDSNGDVFEIESRDGRIVLRGNTGVSIASALNWYLKYNYACHYSFTGGSQLRLPDPLPAVTVKVRRVSSARYHYFLNYCSFGYSLPWFDGPQWERLIDWMALNGINLPLAVTGQEAVWQAAGRRLGWTDQDVREFLDSTAHRSRARPRAE